MIERLPWARPFGRRCLARVTREQSPAHWGRCELARMHPGEDHAKDYGMSVIRWADPQMWDSDDKAGQRPLAAH